MHIFNVNFVCFLQFVNDGGFNSVGMSGISGVPTRTTSTLTPTTLRNIEQVKFNGHFLTIQETYPDFFPFLDLPRSHKRSVTIGTIFRRLCATNSANQPATEPIDSLNQQYVTTIPASDASAATATTATASPTSRNAPGILKRNGTK